MARVFVSLGSNLGDRAASCQQARARLAVLYATRLVRASRLYETRPVGKLDQPDFLNQVLELETDLAPRELLLACLQIEQDLGRVRTERWGPRTLDIDLLLYDDRVIDEPGLHLPHPRMHERRFVLEPLCEIAPEVRHPRLDRSMAEILSELPVAS